MAKTAEVETGAKAVVEEIERQVEEVVDILDVAEVARRVNPRMVIAAACVVASAAGAVGGYFYAKRRLQKRYNAMVDEVKETYAVRRKDDVSLEDLAEEARLDLEARQASQREAEAIVQANGYSAYDKVEPTHPPVVTEEIAAAIRDRQLPIPDVSESTNVFAEAEPTTEWVLAYELEYRQTLDPDMPFVISREEYLAEELGFDQDTLTWFDGDGVLTDTRDTVASVEIIGADNLTRFGHGSDDNNVVYIRNPKLEMDFEIIFNKDAFQEAVLNGHLQHSADSVGVRRFRQDRE